MPTIEPIREPAEVVKLEGTYTQEQHEKIAAKLKEMSDMWDGYEEVNLTKHPDAYDFTFGLITGKELIFSTLPDKVTDLHQKITSMAAVKVD